MSRRFVRCFDSSFVTWSIDGDGVSSFFFFFFVQATSATSPPLLTSLGHSISHWSVPLSLLFIYLYWIFFSRLDLFASSHWCEWGIAAGSSRVPVTLNSFRLNWGFDSIRWLVALCFADEALSRPNQFKLIAVNFRFDFNWQFGLDHPLAPPLCSISHLSPAPLLLLLNHFKEKQLSIEFRGRGCG